MKVKFFDRDMNLLDIRNCQEVSYTRQKNKEYSISFTPVTEKGYDLSRVYFVSFLDDSKGNRLPYSPCGKLVSVSLDGKCSAESIEKYLADVSVLPDRWQWWKGKSLKRVIENHVYGFRTIRFASESELNVPFDSHHIDVSVLENGNGEVFAGKGHYWSENNPYELYFYSDGYVIYRIEIPTEARRQDMVLRWGDVTGGATDIMVRFAWSDNPNSYGEWTTGVSPIRGEGIRPNETEGIDIPESDKKYLFVRFNFLYDTGTISTGFPRGINYSKEITTNREDDNNYVYYGTTAILNYFEIIYRVDTFVQVGSVAVSDSKLLGADVFEKENLLESLKAVSEAYNLVFFCQIDDGVMTLNCFDSYVEDRTNEFIISDTKNMRVSRKDVAIDFIQAVEAYGAGSDNDRIHAFVEYTQGVTVNNVKKFEDSEAHTIEELRESALQYIENENNDITNVNFEYYAHSLSLGDRVKLIVDKSAMVSVVTEEKINATSDGIKKEYVIGVKEYPFRTLFANPFSGKFLEKPKVPKNFVVTRMADGWHATWKGETEKYILRYRRSDTSPYNTHTVVGQQFVFPYTEYEKAYEFVLFAVGENGLLSDGTKTTEVYSGVNNSIESIVNGTADVGRPDQIENIRATASRDGISFYCDILSDGLKNTLGRIDWEIKASGEQWSSARKLSTTVFTGTYNFDRVRDGYPEKDAVGLWEVRAKAVNGYGFESEFYSAVAVVNADGYGTWIQESPTVFNVQSANRAVNMSWQRPVNNLGKEIYGLKYYEIQISKNGTNWYKPAVNKTGKDSESDWYDGTGQLRNDSANYTQSLPLTGQTMSMPENTTYYFRVRTVGETNTSSWSDTQTGIALATGIGDVVAKAIKTEQLANKAVTNRTIDDLAVDTDQLAIGAVVADRIASRTITAEQLSVVARNKINSFIHESDGLTGWTTGGEIVTVGSERALKLTSPDNHNFMSDPFVVQPDELLEFSFGLQCSREAETEEGLYIGLTVSDTYERYIYSWTDKKWNFIDVSTNAFFVQDYRSSTKRFFKTYILGYNIDITTVPSPQYTDESYLVRCLKLSSGKTQTRIRSGYNPITTPTFWYLFSPQVYQVGAGKITANQVVARNLSSISADIGTITSGNLQSVIKPGENIPNVFLNLDTEEFRVGTNPSKDNTDEGEYLHYKPGDGFFLKIKNFIVTSISSMIRGIFKVYAIGKQDSESAFVVNPSDDPDESTGVGANTTYIGTDLSLGGRVVSDLNIDGKVRISNPVERPFRQIIKESSGVIAQSFHGTGKNDLAIIGDAPQKGHIEVKILSPAINDQTPFGGTIFDTSGKEVHSDRLQERDWNVAKSWAEQTRSGKTWRLPTRAELSQINPSGAWWTGETSGDNVYVWEGGNSNLANKQGFMDIVSFFNASRYRYTSQLVGTKIYIPERGGTALDIIDTTTNTVTTLPSFFNANRGRYTSQLVGTKIYIPEYAGTALDIIDTTTNTVTTYANFFNTSRYRRTSQLVDDKIYIPPDDGTALDIIDTTNKTVTTRANFFNESRARLTSQLVGTKIYIPQSYGTGLEIIDTTNNTVTTLPSFFNASRYRYTSQLVGTKIYIPQGDGTALEIIDTTTNTVTTLPSFFNASRYRYTSQLVGTKIYIPQSNGTALDIIDTTTNTVTTLPSFFNASRYRYTNQLVGTKIYILKESSTALEIIHLTTNTFPVRNNTETQRRQVSSSSDGTTWTIRSNALITAGQTFTSYFGLKLRFAGDTHKVGDYWRYEQDEMGAFSLQDSSGEEYVRAMNGQLHVETLVGNVTGNASTATAPLYQWKKAHSDLYRYVEGETPNTTFYWYKVCKITTAMTFDIEVVSDNNYAYRATYRLSVTKYTYSSTTAYTVALFNLGQTVATQAKLAVALDADGYLYIQTNCVWICSLHVTLLYSASSFSVTMDKLGYASFGSASGFTPVKIITQTGGFRLLNGVVTHEASPVINTNITKPKFTGKIKTEKAMNKVIFYDGNDDVVNPVNAIAGIEIGDVVWIKYAGYDKLHTVELLEAGYMIVNYEHCDTRGKGSLMLEDKTNVSATVELLTKWYNAPIGLGQAWVGLTGFRTGNTNYTNTTQRTITVFARLGRSSNQSAAIVVDGITVAFSVNTMPDSGTTTSAGATSLVNDRGVYKSLAVVGSQEIVSWAELR